MFDDTLVLTLGGRFFSEERYLRHAAKLVKTWFLDQNTAMRPNLRYSQVRRGWNKNQGTSSGLIETKDFYFFLDAVKILESLGALSIGQVREFKVWLGEFLNWLLTSPQGVKERRAKNNHGTYYDLQVSSVSAYLGDERLLKEIFHDARGRIVYQFSANGEQPEEMKRTTTAHYCCFNLQGWIHLAQLGESCGEDLWGFEGPQGQSIRKVMEWLLSFIGREWPYQQINEFDRERFFPIYYAYRDRYGMPADFEHVEIPEKEAIKPLFFPHDGIRPFWQLH